MIYFFSYGDKNYEQSKLRLKQEAINFGLFDYIDIYGPEDLSEEFLEKTKPYINMPRGAGYWLWKSFLLKKTFEKMQENDICVYVDTGCTISPYGKETFLEYVKLLNNNDSGIIRFSYKNTPEEMFTTEKVFEYFGKQDDLDFRNSDILMNGIFLMKKCANSIKYVEDYYNINTSAPDIFSDNYNNLNGPKYRDHRHDQSVSSCLVKINGNFIQLDDESFENDMDGWMRLVHIRKIPFLATRIRG